MAAGNRTEDLTVTQGTDALFKIIIKDSTGEVFDVTEKSFSASLKKSYTADDSTAIDFNINKAIPQDGIISISLTDTQTLALDVNTRYVYDVFMYNSVGNTEITSVLKGKVFVEPSVTRVL